MICRTFIVLRAHSRDFVTETVREGGFFLCFSAGRAFPPQVAHGVFVDGGKWGEVGDGDVFVDLVQCGAVRAEFDGRRAVLGEETGVGGAAAGVQL